VVDKPRFGRRVTHLGQSSTQPRLYFIWLEDYYGPTLDVIRPEPFSTNFDFVNFIKHEAEKIIGPYGDKEHKVRCQCLAGKRHLDRVFDAMGVCYAD